MILDRVTVTGADDSIAPEDLLLLTEEFPFVEWGILLSKSQEGHARFPSLKWMEHLLLLRAKHDLNLSGHLCGRWVRELCTGGKSFFEERQGIIPMFKRIQINFHAIIHQISTSEFAHALEEHPVQYIFQLDGVNNWILEYARSTQAIDAVPLFDLSGGAGVLPESWPKPFDGYNGYAGGLSPENVYGQIHMIESVVGDTRIWIDAETHVRSSNDQVFDLDKVHAFLQAAKPWVTVA